jgi:hypothetical protein
MLLVDEGVYSEHGKVNRCDIKPGSVERSRDFLNSMISEKIQRDPLQDPS